MPVHNQIRIRKEGVQFAVQWYRITKEGQNAGKGEWMSRQWYPHVPAAARAILQHKFGMFENAVFDRPTLELLEEKFEEAERETIGIVVEMMRSFRAEFKELREKNEKTEAAV